MALVNFNAETVEPAASYDLLPKGKYLAMAIASELKATKNNTGEYLQLTFEVIDGQFKGRKVFERLNIRNQNKVAEDIAQRALSALCHAVGVLNLQDSDQLHNIPVVLDISIDEAKGDYEAQNRVKGYSSSGGAASRAAAPAAVSAPSAATAGASKPVWKKA